MHFLCAQGPRAAAGVRASYPPRGRAEAAAGVRAVRERAAGGMGTTAQEKTRKSAEIIPGEPSASWAESQRCERKCKNQVFHMKFA